MLAADAVSVRYGRREVLSAVSVAVAPGEMLAVVGPNGAGKSTLMKALAGEVRPSAGRVRLDGADIAAEPAERLARRRAVLPQSSRLAFPFTVQEVVQFGFIAGSRGLGPEARRRQAETALRRVDLEGFGGRFFQELSGGEQQRVHLARVLCQVPDPKPEGRAAYLLLDEPTSSLDLRHQLVTLKLARDFADGGGGVAAILHDLNLAAAFADRVAVIAEGRLAALGPPGEVLTDALVSRVFGLTLRVGAVPAAGIPFILPQTASL